MIEPLSNSKKLPKLPNQKSSIYELTRREARAWYRECCQICYPADWADLSKEYAQAMRDEPEEDGYLVQLSALLAHWFWWY